MCIFGCGYHWDGCNVLGGAEMFENLKIWLRSLLADKCEHDFKWAYSRTVRDQYMERNTEYSLVCNKCGKEVMRSIPDERNYPKEVLENAANNGRPIGSKNLW